MSTTLSSITKLRDIKTGPFGTQLKASGYTTKSTPDTFAVISVGEIRLGHLHITDKTPRVDKNVAQRLPQYVLDDRDVVVSRKGNVDRSSWIKGGTSQYFLGSDGIALRFDTPELARAYSYVLLDPFSRSWLRKHATGSTMLSMNGEILGRLPMPPMLETELCTIAEVLSALDDKIAANDSVISSATALQSALWDQTITDAIKKPLESFVESHLGGTPKRSDDSAWTDEVAWASVKDMSAADQGIIVETAERISVGASESARRLNPLPSGSVFLSARGTVGLVTTNTMPCAINQSAYAFIPSEGKGPALRLAIESLVDRLRARAHGSTFSTITKQDLRESSIPDLNSAEVEDLCPVLNDLEELRIAKAKESRTLATTRDELLPLLMSGKITVADAEKRISE